MARLILHARYFAPNAKKRQGRLSEKLGTGLVVHLHNLFTVDTDISINRDICFVVSPLCRSCRT